MMNRIVMLALVATALLLVPACTTLDGDDRDDLTGAIQKAPREDRDAMAAMIVSASARRYLQGKDPNAVAIRLECRMVHPTFGPAAWTDIPGSIAKPADMITCMEVGHSYAECIPIVIDVLTTKVVDRWEKFKKTMADSDPQKVATFECRGVVNPGFSAADVPGANDDLNRVTVDQMVDWLLGTPTPPIGFSSALVDALAPFVCALSGADGWCDAASSPPGFNGTISPAPSGGSGDYP